MTGGGGLVQSLAQPPGQLRHRRVRDSATESDRGRDNERPEVGELER